MNTLLEAKNISVNFGGIKAVDNFTFNIKENEIISIIGPNGAGKTTVFNLLTGVYKLSSGDIFFQGESIKDLPSSQIVKKGIARTFQNIRLFKDMSVIENVLVGNDFNMDYGLFDTFFSTKKYKSQEKSSIKKALSILQNLNMDDKKDVNATSLPYGEQRKVEIARAISTNAKLLLLDEPAAGMNPSESEELLNFIKKLKALGYTILLIEHDMSVVMKVSDRIYVLENGKLIAQGLPEDIAHNENVIKAYLGGSLIA